MLVKKAIVYALLATFSTSLFAAQKGRAPAKRETLACRLGTEDRHARIAVVLVGGKMSEFAYYSKWKPRTCSIYLQRNDAHSKWADNGNITTVNIERGAFLIEHKPGVYQIIFREVDRERYCGMDGTINGSLTIRKGSPSCELEGIMEEGVPLGQAYANVDNSPPPLASDVQRSTTAASNETPAAAPPIAESAPVDAEQKGAMPGESVSAPAPVQSTASVAPSTTPAETVAPKADAVAPPAVAGAVVKKAEEPSSNPLSAFFRSLSRSRTGDGPSE